QRMRDVLERPVLPLLAGHRDEQPLRSVDDLDVRHDEALIEDDGYERLELFVIDRHDLDVCDLHVVRSFPGQDLERVPSPAGATARAGRSRSLDKMGKAVP